MQQQNRAAIQKEISDLGEDGICPTCRRPLGEHYKILEEGMQGEISAIESKILEFEAKAAETAKLTEAVHAEYTRLESVRRESERIRDITSLKKKQRQELFETVKSILKEDEALDIRIGKCPFSEERFAELEESLNSLESIFDEWRILNERLKPFSF